MIVRIGTTGERLGRCWSEIVRFAVLVVALLVGLPWPQHALAASGNQAPFNSLSRSLQCLTQEGMIPGAVVLVAKEGRTVYRHTVGYQDVATRAPMAEDTIFRFYSMSKPITSVAVMMLVEQGKLALDDPLSRFVPEFKDVRVYESGDVDNMVTVPVRRPITIADLLTHTSGLTYHFTGDTAVQRFYRKHGVKRNTPVGSLPSDAPAAPTLEELVHRLANAPLLHQPGQQFDYSYSTTVLGYVIERVSGRPLDQFLRASVFEPLRMLHTGFFVDEGALGHFVTNYLGDGTSLKAIETRDNTDYRDRNRLLDGGGAIAGTAGDYLRFAQMLANGGELDGTRILKRQTVALMFQDHLPAAAGARGLIPGMVFEFGYGFAIGNASTEQAGWLPRGAVGWDGSGNTFFWVDRGRKQVTVFMTQVIGPRDIASTLKKLVYEAIYGGLAAPPQVCH